MPSSAAATFTAKNLGVSFPPAGDVDIGIATTLRRKQGDAIFSVTFSDASLKDPKSGQGIFFNFEKPLGADMKAAATYDLHKRSISTALTLNKDLSGSDLQLKAIYKQAGDVFILEEQWKFDANNKLNGAYNFSNEEAQFAYTHTRNDWSATARYNFAKDATTLEVSKKQGKATLTAAYGLSDEAVTLTWSEKPFKAALKGNVGRGGVKASQAALTVTHEFEL